MVRLVRACGSKHELGHAIMHPKEVRLVRACGSKQVCSKNHKNSVEVRLVRACGSKRLLFQLFYKLHRGQARKSLWIETPLFYNLSHEKERSGS